MRTRQDRYSFLLAAGTVVFAIVLYDVMGAIVKHLSDRYPTAQLAMYRNLFGLAPTVAILLWSESWYRAGRPVVIRQWKFALARGALGAVAQISFYLAVFYLEFATATAIVFAGPLFVTLLSIPVLGHRVGVWRWVAVLTGFAGVAMVVRPGAESFSWYSLLPLLAALGFAGGSVTARLFDTTVPTALLNLYYTVGTLTSALALVAFTSGFAPIETLGDWGLLAVMGVAGGLAAFCLIAAYRLAEPSSLSPFEYFAIPSSFVLGWVFFSETPFERLIPGVFLIVGGGLVIFVREHAVNRVPRARDQDA